MWAWPGPRLAVLLGCPWWKCALRHATLRLLPFQRRPSSDWKGMNDA